VLPACVHAEARPDPKPEGSPAEDSVLAMDSDIASLLKLLNEVDECEQIEAKRSADEIGNSALETISAFSNEPDLGGGTLPFGVSEIDGAFVATGVAGPGKLTADLASRCVTEFNRPIRPRNDGLLIRRYPEVPMHPDQTYRTAQEHLPPTPK
jgi:hypothetical protein